MHIHKPKAAHSLREFLSEISVIVVGILLALSAEQAIEALHWRHQVEFERESLKANAREQLEVVVARQVQQPCVDRRLSELEILLQRHKAGTPVHLLGSVGRPQNRGVGMEVWQVAVTGQAVGHMGLEEKKELASAFSNYENLHQMMVDADRSWIQLSELDRPDDLEQGDWVELRRAYTQVRATEDRIKAVIPDVLHTQNLGIAPPRVALPDALHNDYSKALCRPLLAH